MYFYKNKLNKYNRVVQEKLELTRLSDILFGSENIKLRIIKSCLFNALGISCFVPLDEHSPVNGVMTYVFP